MRLHITRIFVTFIILVFPLSLFSQGSIGYYSIQNNVTMQSDINKGKTGVLLSITDIEITMNKGTPLIFAFSAYKDTRDKMPVDYFIKEAPANISYWEKMSFEITNEELQNYLGMGTHDVYFTFYAYVTTDTNYQEIEGTRLMEKIIVDLNITDLVDQLQNDKDHNNAFISKKAKTDPVYRSLLNITKKNDLLVAIREFTIGSKATLQSYTWDFLDDEDDPLLDSNMAAFVRFFELLPVDFINETGLSGIVFVKNCTYNDMGVGGGFDVPDKFVICTLKSDPETMIHTIMHEFMHYIDNQLYDTHYFDNEKWTALNRPGTKYAEKGALNMIREDMDLIYTDHPQAGFLNGYCMADLYQDKAEVFSYLFLPSYYKKVSQWTQIDPYLKAKFDFMKKALMKLSPSFSNDYWEKIENMNY